MDQFARIIVGYHGCTEDFARDLLLGTAPVSAWQPSTNDWDWLGHGIYFWEHSPERIPAAGPRRNTSLMEMHPLCSAP